VDDEEDFSSEVEYLIDTTSKVREQKQKSKVTWNLSTDSVKRGVQMFRSRILKRIDEIEEKVDGANSKMVAKTEEEIEAVEIYLSDIQDISHKFDFVAKHGSEKQISILALCL
jgi:ElaB/YqjD/DUF883 family membrane-anchored ribosome-binding protein